MTLESISPLLDKATSYALGIETSEVLTADLVAAAAKYDDVKPIVNTMQAVLTLAANAAGQTRESTAWPSLTPRPRIGSPRRGIPF